jgi:hypothetical protein
VRDLLDGDFCNALERCLTNVPSRITLAAFRSYCKREMNLESLAAGVASVSLSSTPGQCYQFRLAPRAASKFTASGSRKSGGGLPSICFAGIAVLALPVPLVVRELAGPSEMTPQEAGLAMAAVRSGIAQSLLSAEKVSETKPPGDVGSVLRVALEHYFRDLGVARKDWTMQQQGMLFGLASAESKPDFAVGCVLASEFESTELSPLEQLAQSIAVGTNMVLKQLVTGLPWDRCAVLIINSNGHLWQFAAVTLLEPSLPHACVLSPVLDVTSQASDIACLLHQVQRACRVQCEALARAPRTEKDFVGGVVELRKSLYFQKPLERVLLQSERPEEGWFILLSTFQTLWTVQELQRHVVFPLGFLRNEKGVTESLLFPMLSQDWRIGLPEDEADHSLFCDEFGRVVHLLNDKAHLVHLDLLPCNVAWSCEGEGVGRRVHIRLLDFDAATTVGQPIAQKLWDSRVSARFSCSWPGEGRLRVADTRSDAWFVYQFWRLDKEHRLSCSVHDDNGPMTVNDAFQVGLQTVDIDADGFESWHASWLT